MDASKSKSDGPICAGCGAAIPIELQASGGACGYCGAPVRGDPRLARRQRQIEEEELRIEADRRAVAAQEQAYRDVEQAVEKARRGASRGSWVPLVFVLCLALVVGGRVFAGKLGALFDGHLFGGWRGDRPLVCSGDEQLVVEGKDVSLTDLSGPAGALAAPAAILATGDCKLTLRRTTLRSKVAIVAEGNAVVTIEGGRVEGSESAIVARGRARVVAHDAVIASRPGQLGAVQASGSASISLQGGSVDGGAQTAVWLEGDARAELRDVDLLAKKRADDAGNWNGVALSAEGDARAEVRGGTLTGGLDAIHQEGDARLALHDAKVVGAVHAQHADHVRGLDREERR